MSTQIIINLPDEIYQRVERFARLSKLLDRQQSGTLSEGDRSELQTLMQIYQEGLLRKATALSEAVKRGLIRQAWVSAGWHPPTEV
jgi:hypothetical protein